MKIVVCVSHVPDTATKIKISSSGKSIETSGVTFVINPYDEFAVEEALKTKEKFGGDVTVVSFGGDANKETIRKALAMGCDKAVLIKGDNNLDPLSVAEVLANELKNINPEIIFFGKQSVDFDNSAVGQMVAELMGFNIVSTVVKLEISGTNVRAEREIEGGKEVVETSLPVVITAQKGLNEPRFPNLKGIMAAKSKPIEEKQPVSVSNKVIVEEMKFPAGKSSGRILNYDENSVKELVKLLREEAKVI